MNPKYTLPITDENFSEAWNYGNYKLSEIQKKKIIRLALVFVANILFFACATAITLDVMQNFANEAITQFIDSIGLLKVLHNITSPIICHPNLHIAIRILIYMAFLFGVPFITGFLVALIIWFAYRPATPNVATEEKAVDSKTLLNSLREAKIRSQKVFGIASILSIALYIIELLGLSVFFLIHIFTNPELLATNKELLSLFTMLLNPMTSSLISVLFILIYGVYAALNELMSKMLNPLYTTEIPNEIIDAAEKYYYECNPQLKETFDEEERILQQAKEINARRKREEAEFLEKINYVNPIYKRIKTAVLVLVIIASFIFAGSKLKSLDIEKLLNSFETESTEESTETETSTESEVSNE